MENGLKPLSCRSFPRCVWRDTPPSVLLSLCLLRHGCRFVVELLGVVVPADWTTRSSRFCSRRLLRHCRTSLHTSSEDEESRSPVGTAERSSRPPENTSSQTSQTHLRTSKESCGRPRGGGLAEDLRETSSDKWGDQKEEEEEGKGGHGGGEEV